VILYWLDKLGGWVLWLFKRPTDLERARINPNLKCPACGHATGELRCIVTIGVNRQPSVTVQHRCKVCGCRFYENPVAKLATQFVDHASPRNEIERQEDQSAPREWTLLQGMKQ
jgi:hypothetical protein